MRIKALYRVLCLTLTLCISIGFITCVSKDKEEKESVGSIYGVVTEEGTAEVMRAIGVELYREGSLLLKTVTYDDGHYEFSELKAGIYRLKIVADGYEEKEYSVIVEGGRVARQDMQLKKTNTHLTVRTMNVTDDQDGPNATLNGYVSYDNESYKPTEVGFYYSMNTDPLSGTKIIGGLDSTSHSFNAQISNLSFGKYYLQAYGKNTLGITYGDIKIFEKTNLPKIATREATNILAESATLNGYMISDGEPAYTEHGFVYSKSFSTPTIDDPIEATTRITVTDRNKEFSLNVSSLSENSTYYFRAYATHEKGTVYGEVMSFIPKAILPKVSTIKVTNILSESVTVYGRIDSIGEPQFEERGFVYSISYKEPTLNDPKDATKIKKVPGRENEFSANLDSLDTWKTYYVRAYAKSAKGVAYGDTISFIPNADLPIVSTLEVTKLSYASVTLNGRIEANGEPPYNERGFIYSTSNDNPVIDDSNSAIHKVSVEGTSNVFSADVSPLETGKKHFVRAYAKSSKGVSYGAVISFLPQAIDPVVKTLELTNLLYNSVTLNGRIEETGEPPYSERGFIYSTSYDTPTLDDPSSATKKVPVDGTSKDFSIGIESLETGKRHYVRAYVTNSMGNFYGEVISFLPQATMPEVKTLKVTNLLHSSVTLNGQIEKTGQPAYNERGFLYSSSFNNPSINDPSSATAKIPVSGSNKEYSANVDQLETGKIYYARAYATSNMGTAYGEIISFIPQATMPVVKTLHVTNLLYNSATLNGQIDEIGEPAYTERGFVYSSSYPKPTISDPISATTKIPVPGSDKLFSVNIDQLVTGTSYYVRAYATSPQGTSYGDTISFVPEAIMPVVTTLDVSNILSTSATLNGQIDVIGEPPFEERGFIYSSSFQNPTVNDPNTATSKIAVSGTEKLFSANLDSLETGKTYYVRTYAANKIGYSYGKVISFEPQAIMPVVMTLDATNITDTSITMSGRIDNIGEPAYTERGFIYSLYSDNPLIDEPNTTRIVVSGTNKSYDITISSLQTGKRYYIRAYAVSPYGISYGTVISFKPVNPDCIVIEGTNLMVQKKDLSTSAGRQQAINLCTNSRIGGHSDWRLPSLTECKLMYENKNEIQLTDRNNYWTAYIESEYDSYNRKWVYTYAYYSFGNNISYGTSNEYDLNRVRAVRTIEK